MTLVSGSLDRFQRKCAATESSKLASQGGASILRCPFHLSAL